MHAFDYLTTLMSFVTAAAAIHGVAAAADVISAGRRVRVSWLNAGWSLASLLAVLAWWLGGWDLRNQTTWPMGFVLVFFSESCLLYLQVRIVCPDVPKEGPFDLRAFHRENGRTYMLGYAGLMAVTVGINSFFGPTPAWTVQNYAIAPMGLAALAGAALIHRRLVQVSAVGVQLAAWAWYFAALQPPLSG